MADRALTEDGAPPEPHAPSEVPVGPRERLKQDSAVNLNHVQTLERARLVGYVGHLGVEKMRDVCRALAVATGCDIQA